MMDRERICIVKRRARDGESELTRNGRTAFYMLRRPNSREVEPSRAESLAWGCATHSIGRLGLDPTCALQLTPTQAETVRSHPYFKLLMGAAAEGRGIDSDDTHETKIAFNFVFEQVCRARMLTTQDVCSMLQVSKGYVLRLAKTGELKSYKIGRLRRFSLDDVLSLLSESKEIF